MTWNNGRISSLLALSLKIPQSKQPVILSVDDTIIEKFGKSFENCKRLHDHAAHDGKFYVNGHCFVSLILSVPIRDENNCSYLSIPVAYRMWDKEETKLTFSGFKPYSDRTVDYEGAPDIVWTEGTLGYVLLALLLGNETEARMYMDECIKLQNVRNGSGGVLYVTGTYAMLPWEFHVWESVVSSAWLYLLVKNPDVLFPGVLRQVYYMAKISNIDDERP